MSTAHNNITDKNFPAAGQPVKEITLQDRKQLGTNKKLWRLEIYFNELTKNQVCRYYLDNRTSAEVREFRQQIFDIGLMVMIEPGQWAIIPPGEIRQVNIWKQDRFFELL